MTGMGAGALLAMAVPVSAWLSCVHSHGRRAAQIDQAGLAGREPGRSALNEKKGLS
jgi:hypothetical protein